MKQKKYKAIIFPSAENDLFDINDYYINKLKISPQKLFSKLKQSIEILEENPLLFPCVKDSYLNQLQYRMVPIDNYLLFYIIENDTVQIHRFLYGKRNYIDFL